jgi:hypothetical protein
MVRQRIPARLRRFGNRQDRPVTPEVAGSSPVAPVEKLLQIGVLCCCVRHRARARTTHTRAWARLETLETGLIGVHG